MVNHISTIPRLNKVSNEDHLLYGQCNFITEDVFIVLKGYYNLLSVIGELGSVAVKALCYKPERRGFDTR
jgi:hypothetical protein